MDNRWRRSGSSWRAMGKGRGYGRRYGRFGSNVPYSGKTLDAVPAGKKVKIKGILGGANFISRFYSLGLGINSVLKVVSNDIRGLVIEVNGIKYGLGRGFASKIIVEELE